MARGKNATVAQFLLRNHALLRFPGLPVADAAHRRQIQTQVVSFAQPADFLVQSGLQHGIEALGDAFVQDGAVRRQESDLEHFIGRFLLLTFGQQFGHRSSAQAADFEGALQALAVGRMQAGSSCRIKCRQPGVHGRPAFGGGFGIELGTQARIGLRQFGQAIEQGAEVKHRATDQQRYLAGCGCLGHRAQGIGTKTGGGIAFLGRDKVDQAVRVTRQRGTVRLGRADIHVAEDLSRIDADQLDRKTVGQCHGDGRLAGSGRTHDENGGRKKGWIHGGECYHAGQSRHSAGIFRRDHVACSLPRMRSHR